LSDPVARLDLKISILILVKSDRRESATATSFHFTKIVVRAESMIEVPNELSLIKRYVVL
jgi:hypothetical protein